MLEQENKKPRKYNGMVCLCAWIPNQYDAQRAKSIENIPNREQET